MNIIILVLVNKSIFRCDFHIPIVTNLSYFDIDIELYIIDKIDGNDWKIYYS